MKIITENLRLRERFAIFLVWLGVKILSRKSKVEVSVNGTPIIHEKSVKSDVSQPQDTRE